MPPMGHQVVLALHNGWRLSWIMVGILIVSGTRMRRFEIGCQCSPFSVVADISKLSSTNFVKNVNPRTSARIHSPTADSWGLLLQHPLSHMTCQGFRQVGAQSGCWWFFKTSPVNSGYLAGFVIILVTGVLNSQDFEGEKDNARPRKDQGSWASSVKNVFVMLCWWC